MEKRRESAGNITALLALLALVLEDKDGH